MQPGLPETRKTGLLGQFWAKIRTQNPKSNHRVFRVLQKPSILHILPQISGKNSQIWLLPFSVTINFLPVIPLPVTVKHFYRYYRYRPQPYMFEVDDEDWTNDDFMFDQFTRMRLNHIDQDV